MDYQAKHGYRDPQGVEEYVQRRFRGIFGKYRYRIEQSAVKAVCRHMAKAATIADVPCGIGRWWAALAPFAREVRGFDLSPTMVTVASRLARASDVPISVECANAECLPLTNESVDYVFCFALFKHLPVPLQYQVLKEFSRVCSRGVIISYRRHISWSYPFHLIRNRDNERRTASRVLDTHFEHMVDHAGLNIVEQRRCSSPFGVEYVAFLRKCQD